MEDAAMPSMNLVETAVSVDDLSTLVAAVQAGDLVETLSGPGPFTVFAPTNAAFAALPDGTVETLLQPENKTQLQGVLTFHVVPGKLMASDLSDGQMLTTVNGAQLEVSISGGNVMIGGATVAMADVQASNGVAHVIDTVLLP
ncbi:MAG: fasciclin domain-containing protein [Bacteroidota bacterium]